MFSKAPAFGVLRLATFADLPRIGVVAASGFHHSSFWDYERPYASQCPNDTLNSYMKAFRDSIVDGGQMVLVAEDTLERDESGKVYEEPAAIYPSFEGQLPADSLREGRAVVWIACLGLKESSKRIGQFQPEGLFAGRMIIDMTVEHSAYWRRGHCSGIVKWMLEVADLDEVGMGVTASSMGKNLFANVGFQKVENVEIPGYEADEEPVVACLGLCDVAKKLRVQLA